MNSIGNLVRQAIDFHCPVCLSRFDNDMYFPMIVCTVQHSCCSQCLNAILQKGKANKEEIHCPICRQKIEQTHIIDFQFLQEIQTTANDLNHHNKMANKAININNLKTKEQLHNELKKEKMKNQWLIQQYRSRQRFWHHKTKVLQKEIQQKNAQINLKQYEVGHVKAMIHGLAEDVNHHTKQEKIDVLNYKKQIDAIKSIHQKFEKDKPHPLAFKSNFKISDFKIIRKSGQGVYSQVFIAIQKRLDFVCALKIIEKSKIEELGLFQTVIRQIKTTSYLQNPNISRLYGYFYDSKNIYLISEYATDDNLSKYIKQPAKAKIVNENVIIRQLALGVKELVTHGIRHNQISIQNIVLTLFDNLKITGFSWVSYSRLSEQGKRNENLFNDIRSIGFITYQMLHPDIDIKAMSKYELKIDVEQRLKSCTQGSSIKEALNFIHLTLTNQQNALKLINQLINHPFLKLKN